MLHTREVCWIDLFVHVINKKKSRILIFFNVQMKVHHYFDLTVLKGPVLWYKNYLHGVYCMECIGEVKKIHRKKMPDIRSHFLQLSLGIMRLP